MAGDDKAVHIFALAVPRAAPATPAAAHSPLVRLTRACGAPPPPLPPPPPSRTDWTRLVPPPVLTGHVSSCGAPQGDVLTPGAVLAGHSAAVTRVACAPALGAIRAPPAARPSPSRGPAGGGAEAARPRLVRPPRCAEPPRAFSSLRGGGRYSPCGRMLASGDASKELLIWDAAAKSVKVKGFAHHQARLPRRVVGGCLQILSEGTRFLLTLVFLLTLGLIAGLRKRDAGGRPRSRRWRGRPTRAAWPQAPPPPPPPPTVPPTRPLPVRRRGERE